MFNGTFKNNIDSGRWSWRKNVIISARQMDKCLKFELRRLHYAHFVWMNLILV